jgi:hypothetical protein
MTKKSESVPLDLQALLVRVGKYGTVWQKEVFGFDHPGFLLQSVAIVWDHPDGARLITFVSYNSNCTPKQMRHLDDLSRGGVPCHDVPRTLDRLMRKGYTIVASAPTKRKAGKGR